MLSIDEILESVIEETGVPASLQRPEAPTTTPDIASEIIDDFFGETPATNIVSEYPTTPEEAEAIPTSAPHEYIEEDEEDEEEVQEDIDEEVIETQNYQEEYQVSESLMLDSTTTRFRGAPWYEFVKTRVITLAGLGGIGSWTSLFLARMKPKAMFIYDNDSVEEVNMSGQLYAREHFGKTKVTASKDISNDFADYYDVFGIREFFTEESEASDIMICGFDNMQARNTFYNKWKQYVLSLDVKRRSECLYLDGRLAAENLQVFCITGNDAESMHKYETNWLFSDEEADTTVCSYKQTTYCAAMIGSIITNLFVNFCTNLCEPLFERELPFFTTYDAELMQFKTEQ